MRRGYVAKTQLTPREKIHVAYLHEYWGLDMQTLTAIFCVNPGRIAEAMRSVAITVGNADPTADEGVNYDRPPLPTDKVARVNLDAFAASLRGVPSRDDEPVEGIELL